MILPSWFDASCYLHTATDSLRYRIKDTSRVM